MEPWNRLMWYFRNISGFRRVSSAKVFSLIPPRGLPFRFAPRPNPLRWYNWNLYFVLEG